MKKILICSLFGLLFVATGCYENRIQFLEDDMTVDASAHTVMIHKNHVGLTELWAKWKYENGNENSFDIPFDTVRCYYSPNTLICSYSTIVINYSKPDTIKVEIDENLYNRSREIKLLIHDIKSSFITKDSLIITQLANEQGEDVPSYLLQVPGYF